MDDFSEPSLTIPDPSTAFLSPLRPLRSSSADSKVAVLSTSPQCAPPARFLRETTPVNQVSTEGTTGYGGSEVVAGTPDGKGDSGSSGSGSSRGSGQGNEMMGSRMGEYGVKGILRPQGTPGSGNGGEWSLVFAPWRYTPSRTSL
jgi:hypothetical protein